MLLYTWKLHYLKRFNSRVGVEGGRKTSKGSRRVWQYCISGGARAASAVAATTRRGTPPLSYTNTTLAIDTYINTNLLCVYWWFYKGTQLVIFILSITLCQRNGGLYTSELLQLSDWAKAEKARNILNVDLGINIGGVWYIMLELN